MSVPVIAIDGPSGAGKGTVSRAVARQLRWHYLDSGALYRVAGLAATRAGLLEAPPHALGDLIRALDIQCAVADDGDVAYLLDNENVSELIRTEQAGDAASRVAAAPAVRDALTGLQRSFLRAPGLVADGRDMGTVIFPGARLKIYLGAAAAERARRRHKQLKDKGMDDSLPALFADITRRDRRDARREVAPLRPAFDAVCIDTTGVAVEVVIGQVLALAGQAYGDRAGSNAWAGMD